MDEEKLDELWKASKNIITRKVERLEDDAMVALGSVFGQMRSEIEESQRKIKSLRS